MILFLVMKHIFSDLKIISWRYTSERSSCHVINRKDVVLVQFDVSVVQLVSYVVSIVDAINKQMYMRYISVIHIVNNYNGLGSVTVYTLLVTSLHNNVS